MPLGQKRGMRDYVDPIESTISMLDSDQPLPDDDPRTRNGGLRPNRKSDLDQITTYIQLRQNGSISDAAWQRLMKRNPDSAVLFSTIQGKPDNRELIRKYINEGQPATPDRPYTEQDVGSGVGPYQIDSPIQGTGSPAIQPKEDYAGLARAAFGRGNFELAKLARTQGGLDKTTSAGEVTSVKLGAAYHDPSSYDPLSLVQKHGLQKAKGIYKGMFDNAKALERVKYTDERGVGREEVVPRSQIPESGKRYTNYKDLNDDVVKLGTDFQKTMTLENGIDELDKLFAKNPAAVKDATGNVKNIPLSDYLKGPAAREATSIIAGIQTEVVRKNAGLTQTITELEGVKRLLANTAAFSSEDFEKAFRRLQRAYADEKRLAFNKIGPEGKAIAAGRFKMNPDKLPWEERAEKKSGSSDKPLTPAQQRLRSLLDSK